MRNSTRWHDGNTHQPSCKGNIPSVFVQFMSPAYMMLGTFAVVKLLIACKALTSSMSEAQNLKKKL
jgi:hypothetical protein